MIKIEKGAEPVVLADNKVKWTGDLLALIAAGNPVPHSLYTKYNQNEVKDALRKECNSKCMYCESSVEHISYLHIEHIRPKARDKYPELTFEYNNLGLACAICNGNKSDTYDEANTFINPYVDEPQTHFHACGAFIFANAGDDRAKLTELEIDLNRGDLLEQRGERLKTIRGLLDDFEQQNNPTLKTAIRKQILTEIDIDKVYSFCISSYANTRI
jgi:uncharacterized protein (TIGR02646 family)